ncbi:hypothetical protein FHS27_004326 [Rhodopirellula rubra]|uniref:Uncharacterized protein n=1 Tax=Aporhodopirellula rubra TaxID=980271 RepID=A0A7W5E2B4_9BACT|nr:hypothetical protein [Aporhodopirellula rubra]MBB3208497.1 hypothetical protein [Aporhodopirellula rubra]
MKYANMMQASGLVPFSIATLRRGLARMFEVQNAGQSEWYRFPVADHDGMRLFFPINQAGDAASVAKN